MRPRQPTCADVLAWPELQALCRRLGVGVDRDTSFLRIMFVHPDAPVQVEHHFHATDTTGRTQASSITEHPAGMVSPYLQEMLDKDKGSK